jgi:tetratricopeptide (TPR) repeat protein
MSLALSDILKSSYKTNKEAKKDLLKHNYVLDKELSNHNQKIFYNPVSKKLLMLVAGTHNIADVGTDLYLAAGKLKETKRYNEAKKILEKARERYPSAAKNVDIAAHSLGGSIASGIGKRSDRITTYNKGSTIGENYRDNEKVYRTKGDVVSFLAPNAVTLEKETTNLRANQKEGQRPTFFKSHNIDNLSNIFLDDQKKEPELIYDPNAGDSVEFQNYSL